MREKFRASSEPRYTLKILTWDSKTISDEFDGTLVELAGVRDWLISTHKAFDAVVLDRDREALLEGSGALFTIRRADLGRNLAGMDVKIAFNPTKADASKPRQAQ